MATTIKLKNSVTTTNAPSSLAQGEVAINVTDKKVWVGNAATTPVQLLGTGSDGSFTNLTVSGTTALNGGATLGDASGDALTINSSAVSIPNGLNFDSNTLVIDATNNRVGVGLTSPAYAFDAEGDFRHRNFAGGSLSGFFNCANTGSVTLNFGGTTTPNKGRIFYSDNSDLFSFFTNSTERMRIDSSGNVGIGTSSPTARVHISSPDGTAPLTLNSAGGSDSTRALNFNIAGDNYGKILVPSASGGAMAFWTGGANAAAERMRIDSSGNVGIGTSSPTNPGSFGCVLNIDNAGGSALYLSDDGSVGQVSMFGTSMSINNRANGATLFSTNATERMRIDSSGNLLVGITAIVNSQSSATINNTNSSYPSLYVRNTTASNVAALRIERGDSDGDAVTFYRGTSQKGYITVASTGTTYNTLSDYRLKENVEPMTGALAKVSALNPVVYDWKGIGKKGQGFIAHELQAIVPECVTGLKDELDDDGNPRYQGIDTSFLVATLTAAIQEQQAIINDLKARIETLESK